MIELIRLLLVLIPAFAFLLVALVIVALMSAFGPALIPAAILGVGGLAVWIFLNVRR